MAVFPSYAKVLLEGFKEDADYGVLRTDMDGGITKQRRRWTTPIVTRDVVIHVGSVAQKNAFDAWVRSDLNGGGGWFGWTDPLDLVLKQARFVSGKVSWSSPGRVWRATAQLETVG
ncbi:hypothetical protein P3W66_07750 [Achromobacter denitrificans]|uniref:hypothetical protein n=1 Tax=Achromobacter denitrificans TaxID=32002 RepID=UPI0023E44FD6|nr:hypothetical protein [Achromobacter denitrificans]MDF3939921.1 hypothetical protein [Achromobacter denitrificans]